MRCLVMSVKAGFGHHSTGQAIMDYMERNGAECVMLDAFEHINPKLSDSISDSYLFITKYLHEVYGKAYSLLDKRDESYDKHSLVAIMSKLVTHKIKDFVEEFKPDVVIGTHSYACLLMTYLKEKEYITCPTYGIVTDFTVHPFWESTELDYYVTADELLNNQMNKKGIPNDKILPFGIPIKEKFSKKTEKCEARKALGIKDKFTLLVMMGSMGFGNMTKTLQSIDDINFDLQVLCVCGNNQKTKKEIDSNSWKKDIISYGFVDNIDVLMDSSDVIVTKPGGLTTSELLAKKLPAIIMNPIPGQEDRNMEFLVNSGAAVMVTDTFGVDEALYQIVNNQWRLELLKMSVERIGKPDSTKKLCDFIFEALKSRSENKEIYVNL